MKRTVYIETSIPSFCCTTRTDVISLARKEITQRWWSKERHNFEVLSSAVVIAELGQGNYPSRNDALEMMRDLELLKVTHEINDIVEVYVQHKLMPTGNRSDAFHLAVASYYGVHFLLTWNCKHLANAKKFEHLQKINYRLGMASPAVITPEQLFSENQNDGI